MSNSELSNYEIEHTKKICSGLFIHYQNRINAEFKEWVDWYKEELHHLHAIAMNTLIRHHLNPNISFSDFVFFLYQNTRKYWSSKMFKKTRLLIE